MGPRPPTADDGITPTLSGPSPRHGSWPNRTSMAGCSAASWRKRARLRALRGRSLEKLPGSTPWSHPHRVWLASPVRSTEPVGVRTTYAVLPGVWPGI